MATRESLEMADRFFANALPDCVAEREDAVATSTLYGLLSLPYPKLADKLLEAALDLKEKVVQETWIRNHRRVDDYTLYTGSLGTAFLLFNAYQVTNNFSDLSLCGEIVKACDLASKGTQDVTFICGRAGVCALGAVAAKYARDEPLLSHYLRSFSEIKLPGKIPNELLYGRAGYLWTCSFLNNHLGKKTIPSTWMGPIMKEIIRDGKRLSNKGRCPLMYEWYGEEYWGVAHGLAGIMHVLMDMELDSEEQQYVKGTLSYMIQNRFPSGNYPLVEGPDADHLVHWCHGAPGIALMLNKAAKIFEDEQFLQAATEAAEVVWNR